MAPKKTTAADKAGDPKPEQDSDVEAFQKYVAELEQQLQDKDKVREDLEAQLQGLQAHVAELVEQYNKLHEAHVDLQNEQADSNAEEGAQTVRRPIEHANSSYWVDPFSGLRVHADSDVNPTNGVRRDGDEAIAVIACTVVTGIAAPEED